MSRHERHTWATMLLRVMLGVIFVMHGWYGWRVVGPEATGGYMVRMGFPEPWANLLVWYLFLVHLAGGALIIVGLWTSLMALLQVPIMASAVFLLHWPQGFFLRGIVVDAAAGRAIAGGYEYALLVLIATLALALLGGGALSVDAWRDATAPREYP